MAASEHDAIRAQIELAKRELDSAALSLSDVLSRLRSLAAAEDYNGLRTVDREVAAAHRRVHDALLNLIRLLDAAQRKPDKQRKAGIRNP
jgi:hypothetical protein